MNVQCLRMLACTVAVACGVALAQRDYSNVRIKTTHVAGNIYMLEGSGGTKIA